MRSWRTVPCADAMHGTMSDADGPKLCVGVPRDQRLASIQHVIGDGEIARFNVDRDDPAVLRRLWIP